MLNLHKLEIFSMVAQEGSFSRAAERLYMTQAAVSQHMRELENVLGTALFVRGRRGVHLTPSGERLAEYAERIFALVREAELAVAEVGNLAKNHLTLGATTGVSIYFLPELAQPFTTRYPQMTLSVVSHNAPKARESLMAHQIDLALIEDDEVIPEADGMGAFMLQPVELVVVVGRKHPWWGRGSVAMGELDGQMLVARQAGSYARVWLDEALANLGVTPRIMAEFDSPESVKRAVMAGVSLTLLPDYILRDEVQLGLLHAIRIDDRPLRRAIHVMWDTGVPPTPVARAFAAYLSERYPGLSKRLR